MMMKLSLRLLPLLGLVAGACDAGIAIEDFTASLVRKGKKGSRTRLKFRFKVEKGKGKGSYEAYLVAAQAWTRAGGGTGASTRRVIESLGDRAFPIGAGKLSARGGKKTYRGKMDALARPGDVVVLRVDARGKEPVFATAAVKEKKGIGLHVDIAPMRDLVKALARKFGIKTKADEQCFDLLWPLYQRASKFSRKNKKRMRDEAARAFRYLKMAAFGTPDRKKIGHRLVKRLPVTRKYVIFSDQHMSHDGNRQDFFRKSGNVKIYRAALEHYARAEYTLVENGDVEELIIFDPTIAECRARAAMSDAQLDAHRQRHRLGLLKKVLSTYRGLYEQINDGFHRPGRLVKIAGNHDQSLQDPHMLEELRKVLPGVVVHDYLVVEAKKKKGEKFGRPLYVAAHGHQFDPVTAPRYSPRAGEVISECLAWAFEGADRVWRWKETKRYVLGEPFNNRLATGKAGNPFKGEKLIEAIVELALGHEIAWEYYRSKTRLGALTKEVLTGKQWIKFRHMSETFVVEKLIRTFRGTAMPTLILGHSHEVRHLCDYQGKVFTHYANSGASGRFQNLLWGIEIVGGEARVVAWSFRNWPARTGLERHTYTSRGGRLVPSRRHVPLGR